MLYLNPIIPITSITPIILITPILLLLGQHSYNPLFCAVLGLWHRGLGVWELDREVREKDILRGIFATK